MMMMIEVLDLGVKIEKIERGFVEEWEDPIP